MKKIFIYFHTSFGVFLTSFEVSGNVVKHFVECLIYLECINEVKKLFYQLPVNKRSQ